MKLLRPVWLIVWRSTAFLVLWGVGLSPFILVFRESLENVDRADGLEHRLYLEAAAALTIVMAAWAMARFVDGRAFVSLGFAPGRLLKDFLAGTVMGTGWLLLSLSLLWLAGWLVTGQRFTLAGAGLVWASVAMLLNTITQEVLARGYIFQLIQSTTGCRAAVIISALLFTAYHAGVINGAWLAAVNIFLAGLLFGAAFIGTGNLWLPIGLHFSWNVLLGPVLGLTVSGNDQVGTGAPFFSVRGPAIFTGGEFGIEGGAVVTATTICGIGLLSWVLRKRSAG